MTEGGVCEAVCSGSTIGRDSENRTAGPYAVSAPERSHLEGVPLMKIFVAGATGESLDHGG